MTAKIEKPTQDAQGRIRYDAAIRYLEGKYGFNSYDFNESSHHETQWYAAQGKSTASLTPDECDTLYQAYRRAPDGERSCPEPENFWHWMIDLVSPGPNIKLPATFRFNVRKVLDTYDDEVAPVKEAHSHALAAHVGGLMNLIPADMREAAKLQFKPKSAKLKPYIRTILGYFEVEFGSNVKLDFRRD